MAGLFDYQSPENMRAARLQPLLVSGAQMGSQPLLSQLVSQMSNAGANIGATGAGMLGLQLPEEAAQQRVKDIMQGVAQDDVEGLKAAAQKFADIGDTQRANALIGRANEAETLGFARQDRKTAQDQIKAAATQKENLKAAIGTRLPKLTQPEIAAIANDPKAVSSILNPKVETEVVEAGGKKLLIDSNSGKTIADLGTAPRSDMSLMAGGVSQLASLMAGNQAKEAARAGGGEVGKQVAQVGAGYKSLSYLTDALDIIKDGIYSGGYGPLQEATAKFTKGVVGDAKRLSNTEEFRAYIGNVVIPMMAQLGGSDSNEELKKMEQIVAGDTTLEETAIKNIITSAQKAVRNDLARLEKQQKAVVGGTPLPVGPLGGTKGVTASGVTYTVGD
jgi:hypothetical protein